VPDFPGAEAGEAKVRLSPLVLIGGILPPGGIGRGAGSLYGKLGRRARLSWGGLMESRGFHQSAGAHWRLAGFTENAGIVPAFPGAEAGEAKVRLIPLVLIGG